MPVVSVVLAGLMMQSRWAIRLGMRIACRRTPTAFGFGGYSLWTPDSRECGYSAFVCTIGISVGLPPVSDKKPGHTTTHLHEQKCPLDIRPKRQNCLLCRLNILNIKYPHERKRLP